MEGGMIDSTIQILKEMGVQEYREKLIREGKIEGISEGYIEGYLEDYIESYKEGIREGKISVAKNLLKMGYSIKLISEATELDIEEIKTLKENI